MINKAINDKEIFELEIRRKIYNFITKYPGLHNREISRKMDLSKSSLCYHLSFLKKRELILEKSDGIYTRYYPAKKFGIEEIKIFNLLRQDLPLKVIVYIETYPDITLIDIARFLKKDPRTIAYHIKKLKKIGLVETNRFGREVRYRTNKNDILLDLLVSYQKSLLDEGVNRYVRWLKTKSGISISENVTNVIYEIFPHPYYA